MGYGMRCGVECGVDWGVLWIDWHGVWHGVCRGSSVASQMCEDGGSLKGDRMQQLLFVFYYYRADSVVDYLTACSMYGLGDVENE